MFAAVGFEGELERFLGIGTLVVVVEVEVEGDVEEEGPEWGCPVKVPAVAVPPFDVISSNEFKKDKTSSAAPALLVAILGQELRGSVISTFKGVPTM